MNVVHHHFIAWPDHGVPRAAEHVLQFLQRVRQTARSAPEKPIVIHCRLVWLRTHAQPQTNIPPPLFSVFFVVFFPFFYQHYLLTCCLIPFAFLSLASAGIGRTGTFLVIDVCLELFERNRGSMGIEILSIIHDARMQRATMVQTADQLEFCYLAVTMGVRELEAQFAREDKQAEEEAAAAAAAAATASVTPHHKRPAEEVAESPSKYGRFRDGAGSATIDLSTSASSSSSLMWLGLAAAAVAIIATVVVVRSRR